MNKYITHTKDVIGNNYIAIKYTRDEVSPFLDKLRSHLGEELFNLYTSNQQERDRGTHHMTVINVMDFNKLIENSGPAQVTERINHLSRMPITDIQLKGVGTAQKGENVTYFVVAESQMLKDIRNSFNLPEHDFHITLGFHHKDVFGVRKNKVMEYKDSSLLDMLRRDFQDRHNLDFLKRNNWPIDEDKEIIPVKLTDTILEVICGDQLLGITSIEDGKGGHKYHIVYTTGITEEKKRLPLTEIIEFLKK
jgi:hypothetical protein